MILVVCDSCTWQLQRRRPERGGPRRHERVGENRFPSARNGSTAADSCKYLCVVCICQSRCRWYSQSAPGRRYSSRRPSTARTTPTHFGVLGHRSASTWVMDVEVASQGVTGGYPDNFGCISRTKSCASLFSTPLLVGISIADNGRRFKWQQRSEFQRARCWRCNQPEHLHVDCLVSSTHVGPRQNATAGGEVLAPRITDRPRPPLVALTPRFPVVARYSGRSRPSPRCLLWTSDHWRAARRWAERTSIQCPNGATASDAGLGLPVNSQGSRTLVTRAGFL